MTFQSLGRAEKMDCGPSATFEADSPRMADRPPIPGGPSAVDFLTRGPNGGPFTQRLFLGVPEHFYKADSPREA